MALSINTNIAATNAYRNLSSTQNSLGSSLEKLSSGFRINRAADDAAGLAISEGLRSQVGGLTVAVRNAQDGISVVQTAEGALTESHAILQRMRDLSVQASNSGGLNDAARTNIQSEITELTDELDRIATTTKFNGSALLNGNYNGKFQIGANSGENITVTIADMSATGLGVNALDVQSTGGPAWALAPGAFDFAGAAPAADPTLTYDGVTYTLDIVGGWTAGGTEAAAQANFKLVEQELASKLGGSPLTAQLTEFGGLTISGPTGALVGDLTGSGITATASLAAGFAAGSGVSGAESAIGTIDGAIALVSGTRAELGAKQNRLDHTINSLNVSIENLTASESRIRDTDMAQEMVNFTKNQILSQAGTAMLAQANQIPQGILQLLQ